MRKLAAALFLFFGLASAALAQNTFDQSTQATAFFNNTQAATRVVSALPSERIYLTQLTISATNTSVVTITRGTGTACGTNTVVIFTKTFATGDLNFVTGDGTAAMAVVGSGVDVCITVSTAAATGWLSWTQF